MLEELAEASIDGTRKQHIESLVTLPLRSSQPRPQRSIARCILATF
jgi:hypothetical protein